jgi:hypothetical protein
MPKVYNYLYVEILTYKIIYAYNYKYHYNIDIMNVVNRCSLTVFDYLVMHPNDYYDEKTGIKN